MLFSETSQRFKAKFAFKYILIRQNRWRFRHCTAQASCLAFTTHLQRYKVEFRRQNVVSLRSNTDARVAIHSHSLKNNFFKDFSEMSFLSQRFDNLSTSDNKENRVKSAQKILRSHDENVSPTKVTTVEVLTV